MNYITQLIGIMSHFFRSETAEEFAKRILTYSQGYRYKGSEVKSTIVTRQLIGVLLEETETTSAMEVSILITIYDENRKKSSSLYIEGVRSKWDESMDMPSLWFWEIISLRTDDDAYEVVLRGRYGPLKIRLGFNSKYLLSRTGGLLKEGEPTPYADVFK